MYSVLLIWLEIVKNKSITQEKSNNNYWCFNKYLTFIQGAANFYIRDNESQFRPAHRLNTGKLLKEGGFSKGKKDGLSGWTLVIVAAKGNKGFHVRLEKYDNVFFTRQFTIKPKLEHLLILERIEQTAPAGADLTSWRY